MNTIPVAYFCHHKDLEVPPHKSYALRPTLKHPCLLAVKIQFLKDAGGFGPFFLLVDSEETKQACSHLEAEDVHAVVVPESYPHAPSNFNRKIWNLYHPRNDCDTYHYAAYILMKSLHIPVLMGDVAHTQPPDRASLDYVKSRATGPDFELVIAFTELGTSLHLYNLNSLQQFFNSQQKYPYSIHYSAAHNIKNPEVFFSPNGTMKSGVTPVIESRLISRMLFDWWSPLVDTMERLNLEAYINCIKSNPADCNDVVVAVNGLDELKLLHQRLLKEPILSVSGRPTVFVTAGNAESMNEFYGELLAMSTLPLHKHLMIPHDKLHTISSQLLDVIDVLELEFTCDRSDELFNALDANSTFGIGFTNLVNYCIKKPVVLGIALIPHPTDPTDTVYFFKGWHRLLKSSPLSGLIESDNPQFIDFVTLKSLA